ncbi:MAG: hypothetical protein KDD61_03705 [Bdellovibrionales bacterium]|nr:hypothetical protein [Bdellovibrionales bacterium]
MVRLILILLMSLLFLSACKLNQEILSTNQNIAPPALPPPSIPSNPVITFQIESKADGTGTPVNLQNLALNANEDLHLIKREDGTFVEQVSDVKWQVISLSDPKENSLQSSSDGSIHATAAGQFKIRIISPELSEDVFLDMNVEPVMESFNHPYYNLALADVSTLSDSTVPSLIDGTTYTRLNPYSGRNLTVDGAVTWTGSSNIFLRADTLTFQNNAIIIADGKNYVSNSIAGAGGSGGGAPTGCGGTAGAGGSNGGNGVNATGGSCMGTAGVGYGSTYSVGFSHYGIGGDGGNGSNSAKGSGSNGAGGGGGATYNLWGGGAGGGGLIVIVANTISGNGMIRAKGGDGRHGVYSVKDIPGGGGGGVIFVATKNYSGNLQASAMGGKTNGGLNYSGQEGTARIFQIMPDDSLIERNFTDSWDDTGAFTPNNSTIPYPISILPDPNSLSDETLSDTTINGYIYTRINPYTAKQLTISGTVQHELRKPSAIFLRAIDLIFSPGSMLSANGEPGHNGHYGGEGGNGGAGGTGCSQTGKQDVSSGGVDGPRGGGTCPSGGGVGWGSFYSDGFFYGTGGRGGDSDISAGGLGSNGAGGGGHATYNLWGGGGGGGGLIVIVAESISGPGTITAKGGDRNGSVQVNGAGGGGVIWIATKTYSGELTIDVSHGVANGPNATAGKARIFKIESDNSLTEKSFDTAF